MDRQSKALYCGEVCKASYMIYDSMTILQVAEICHSVFTVLLDNTMHGSIHIKQRWVVWVHFRVITTVNWSQFTTTSIRFTMRDPEFLNSST